MGKIVNVSRDEKAARAVALVIDAGLVVKSFGPTGDFTVGPYTKAVGPASFALFGYGRNVPDTYRSREGAAIDVARSFVSCVGAGRAREAAMRTPGRPAFSTAAADIARKTADHLRVCRRINCREC